ncbi:MULTISPECIES: SidA/IucD/PvdA family monooxygenase [unclassified Streptomyces]|uniref:lysine N(6)-hydroxylase/L-ornithine N(5)-oxygenase family protein n=1 Tax=unclassified Streptomyces TaxID=2593676 RepID=UPI003369D51D
MQSYPIDDGSPTSSEPGISEDAVYDILGVGFGPSNIALAVAVDEQNAQMPERPLRAGFLERKEVFGWHEGMLLESATMQISFLKDLVTMRNPRSRFTFLEYLSACGRLVPFINHKTLFPLRTEFHDYLEWVADQFGELVRYGSEVVDVRPVDTEGVVGHLDVVSHEAGDLVTRRTRNLVVASGIVPSLPPGVERSDRLWHSAEFLTRLRHIDGAPSVCTVVGAGQSGAEVAAHLHENFPDAAVHVVLSRYGYSPADDSPFVNRIFDPEAVDEFYFAPPPVQQKFFEYHANTNYSVVDTDLIEDLYRRLYRETVRGRRRLHMHRMTALRQVETSADRVRLHLEHLSTGGHRELDSDLVVFATGYRPMDPLTVLGTTADLCKRDATGRLRVQRDHRVVTVGSAECGIYLQGGTEHTHGLSSSLLSTAAVRSGEIVRSIVESLAGPGSMPSTRAGATERQERPSPCTSLTSTEHRIRPGRST